MIIRFVSGLAGLAVLAASAYATIIHTGADFAQTILICASVGGLVAGAIVAAHVGGWYRFGVIVFILAGELVGGWMTFERTIELREYRVAIRLQQQEAVKVARDRLSKAEGTLKAAQGAVVSQSSLNGCKANCRQLLQDAVNAASSEVNTARAALSALPAPALADVSASKTGLEAWKISLAVAIALVLSTNGMGALLIAVAAHPVARLPVSVAQELPIEKSSPPPVSRKRVRFPATNVVDFQGHKVLRALESERGPVSNARLAELLGETEGEASKSWREVSQHLEIGRQGQELRIAIKRTA